MKVYDFTSKDDNNIAFFYIDRDGDIWDSEFDAKKYSDGIVAKVVVHGFFVGSSADMRKNAHKLYKQAKKRDLIEGEDFDLYTE